MTIVFPVLLYAAERERRMFAASEIAAVEIAAKNRPPCKGPPI